MADSPLPAPPDLCTYEPPVSLWALVETYVPQHEWQEVKLILGESLVEQSLELQEEVKVLLEIWRDYRAETDQQHMYHRLPEPPAARERLVQEIRFFVDSIREKSSKSGRDVVDVFSNHNKDVLEYVLENKKGPGNDLGSRPSTARSSQDGRDTPMAMHTPDRLSVSSSVSDQVESMQDKLSFLKLDDVVQHLRETISQEVDWLMEDINFLQKCLEDEADFRCGANISREPTLTDLREERSKLEKELLSNEPEIPRALRNENKQIPTIQPPVKAGKLSISRPLPPAHSPGSTINGRGTPLKTSHQISSQVLQLQDLNRPVTLSRPSSGSNHSKQASSSLPKECVITRQENKVLNKATDAPPSHSGDRKHIADGPSHLTIRTATLSNNAKVVAVSGIPASTAVLSPSPPMSAKPSSGRPGSAQRFRKMVMQCRDET